MESRAAASRARPSGLCIGAQVSTALRYSLVVTWTKVSSDTVFRHAIFELEKQELERDGVRRDALVVKAPDWVNVVPLLDDGRVVLIRQWRYGVGRECLEIPGGLIDPGESPGEAAVRELLEETGYRAEEWRELGTTLPNPAFLSNRLTTFIARGLEEVQGGQGVFGVDDERITVEPTPLERVPELIATGEIDHALVVAAFHLFDLDRTP